MIDKTLETLRIWGFDKTLDVKSTYSDKADLYYKQISDFKYLIFNHYYKKGKKELQGFDCWIAEYKGSDEIGEIEPSRLDEIKLSISLPEDFHLISDFLNSNERNRFPESEVVIRLVEALINNNELSPNEKIIANIDGAQVKSGKYEVFNVGDFLKSLGWKKETESQNWRGVYLKEFNNELYKLNIQAKSGNGDLTGKLRNHDSKYLYVECKKGELPQRGNSEEYKLLREAIGQIATLTKLDTMKYQYLICVPENAVYSKLMNNWKESDGIKKLGIKFGMINRENTLIKVN